MSRYAVVQGQGRHYVDTLRDLAWLALDRYRSYANGGEALEFVAVEERAERPLNDFEWSRLLRLVAVAKEGGGDA